MNITSFDDLLKAARLQNEPQRLLFVFTAAELSEGASAQQRARYEAGEGGELAPLMCVDKSADELADFGALAAQAALAGPPWAIVFAAALSGRGGIMPSSDQAQAPLQHMVEAIKSGRLDGMLPFDRHGEAVALL